MVRHGVDRAASRYGVDEADVAKDSSLGETPARDPRRFGHRGAYPRVGKPSQRLLARLYEEVGVFSAVVDQWAEDTWSEGWTLDTKDERWAKEAARLDDEVCIGEAFTDADRWHIVHGASLIYFNLEDATGDRTQEPRGVQRVLRTQTVTRPSIGQPVVDDDEDSDRNGEVALWRVRLRGHGMDLVHHGRVLHVRERPRENDPVNGIARARRILDDVLGYENLKWATYESYWQRAAPYLVAQVNPNARMNPTKAAKIKDEIDKLQSGIIQKVLADSFELKALNGASGLVNPKSYWDVAADSISVSARIPKHIVFGSASGQLASSTEDTSRYYGRVSRRQGWATKLLLQWYELAAEWGLLPPVPDDLVIRFQSLDEPTFKEVLEVELLRAQALEKYRLTEYAPPQQVVDYEPGTAPPGPEPPRPEPAPGTPFTELPPEDDDPEGAEAPGAVLLVEDRDGTYRPWRVWEYTAHDAPQKVEVPELKPVRVKYQARIAQALHAMLAPYLEAFQDDPRIDDLPEETVAAEAGAGDRMDPDDDLIRLLLALQADPEALADVLFLLMRDAAQVGGLQAFRRLGIRRVFEFVDDTDIRLFRTLAQATSEAKAAQLTEVIRRGISEGLVNGESLHQLRGRVLDTFDSLAGHQAEMIARSEAMRGYNVGAREGMRQAGLQSFEFQAFDAACEICAPLDGKTFALDQSDKWPPLHPNCRCEGVPVRSELEA